MNLISRKGLKKVTLFQQYFHLNILAEEKSMGYNICEYDCQLTEIMQKVFIPEGMEK